MLTDQVVKTAHQKVLFLMGGLMGDPPLWPLSLQPVRLNRGNSAK